MREFDTISRNKNTYNSGQRLFGIPEKEYPRIDKIAIEMDLLSQMYRLYEDVLNTFDEYKVKMILYLKLFLKKVEKKIARGKMMTT